MKSYYFLLIILAVVIAGGFVYVMRPGEDVEMPKSALVTTTPVDNTTKWPPEAPGSNIEPISQVVRVTLKTNKGDIKLALDGTRAPLTVGNFVKLANDNVYDGTMFHRVIPDFMIQGGDPFSKDPATVDQAGQGGPGYVFPDEINAASYGLDKLKLKDAVDPQQLAQLKPEVQEWTVQQFYEAQGYSYTTQVESLPLVRGVVAMANSGPNTNGSQFFIITAENVNHLNGKHTPFGVVEAGMDVIDAISQVERDDHDKPLEPVIIQDVEVDMGAAGALKMEKSQNSSNGN